jgi:hypothetical protein
MRTGLVDRGRRSVAREAAFSRILFGTKDAGGLVSRCGHYGPPH